MRVRFATIAIGLIASLSAGNDSTVHAQIRLSTGNAWPQSLGDTPIESHHSHYGSHHGGHHDSLNDLNLGLILTPELLYGWGANSGYYNGGNYPSAAGGYQQPILNQPPFYYGQPAPNYYTAPTPNASSQSQYLTPQAVEPRVISSQTPPVSADAQSYQPQTQPTTDIINRGMQRPATTAAAPESTPQRRRSILVRPESAPQLRSEIAAESPGRADYEISLSAFAKGDYQEAAEAARSANAADSGNGKLQLYLAQCEFAVGDFKASAESLAGAFELLPSNEWGLVVENFRQFYKQNDYVAQVERLLAFSEQSGNQSLGQALQAYHYYYLGHPDSAANQLRAALKDQAPHRLATELRKIILSGEVLTEESLPAPFSENE